MFKPQPISSTDARKYLSQIINKVQFSSKSFVVQSYRKPAVRIVKEEYIAALEEVLGKKTISQFLQISGNDNLFDAAKIIEIKKIFQRRLSGAQRPDSRPERLRSGREGVEGRLSGQPHPQHQVPPQQQPKPQSQPQQKPATQKAQKNTETQKSVGAKLASPKTQSQPSKPRNPNPPPSNTKPRASNNRVLLLSNGKNYQ